MKREFLIGVLIATTLLATAFAGTAFANPNWRAYNIMPATSFLWDINRARPLSSGGVEFPLNQFETKATGSFVVYLFNNYNYDMTGKTITATVSWTITGTGFETRSTSPGAYVRLVISAVTGQYTYNDYWWSTQSLDLNALTPGGTLAVSLTDRTQWTNLCGKRADDTALYSGPDCVGGVYPAVSPYDGFTNAVKNVKQVGLSFGSSSRYASGVAVIGGSGTFQLLSYTIES